MKDPFANSHKYREMHHIESGTLDAYRLLAERIRWEMERSRENLIAPGIRWQELIHVSLHLRRSLELITYSSFIANHVALTEVGESLQSPKTWSDVRKVARKHNMAYWPYGLIQDIDGSFKPSAEGLPEAAVGQAFGLTSELVHVQNPAQHPQRTPEEYYASLVLLYNRLVAMLERHVVHLSDSSEIIVTTLFTNPIRVQGAKVIPAPSET